jgi:hypothetical protein
VQRITNKSVKFLLEKMSNSLENVEFLELLDRYNDLLVRYVSLAKDLSPQLEKFGKYRKELQLISVEFVRRGFKPDEPESLVKLVESELERVKNVVQTTDSSEGSVESRPSSEQSS